MLNTVHNKHPLLIIEDSDEDFEITCWALAKANLHCPIERSSKAEEVLLSLSARASQVDCDPPLPKLILLDLNLPSMGGQQFLEKLKLIEHIPIIPVVVLSTSNNPRDIENAYRLGAQGYICKPLSLEVYVKKMQALVNYWFDAVEVPNNHQMFSPNTQSR